MLVYSPYYEGLTIRVAARSHWIQVECFSPALEFADEVMTVPAWWVYQGTTA